MNSHLWKIHRLIAIIFIIFVTLIIIPKVTMSQGPTTIRPIGDFISTQGTYCFPDGMGGCILFVPPIQNFLGWSDPDGLLASVDYAGLADDWLNGLLGTEFDGTVRERPLADGRAQVRVVLHTKNALTWVVEGDDFATSPLIFGYRAPDVAAGETPGLADSHMNIVFINSEPGAPLPDLMQLAFAPEPGQELRFLKINATANGPLVPDGTPAKATVTQTGIFRTPFMGAVSDGFPVERIKIQEVGN